MLCNTKGAPAAMFLEAHNASLSEPGVHTAHMHKGADRSFALPLPQRLSLFSVLHRSVRGCYKAAERMAGPTWAQMKGTFLLNLPLTRWKRKNGMKKGGGGTDDR